jgi:hypothetical protein
MSSNVDPTVPAAVSPTTASVRNNFSVIKTELETLQNVIVPTFAQLPNPTVVGKTPYFVQEVGRSGAFYVSNGTDWLHASTAVLAATAEPIVITGTVAETLMLTVPLIGITRYSCIRIEPIWLMTNSANGKTFNVKVGTSLSSTTSLYSRTRTTATTEGPLLMVTGRGTLQSQSLDYTGATNYFVNSGTALYTSAIDFSVLQYLYITGSVVGASETLALSSIRVTVS